MGQEWETKDEKQLVGGLGKMKIVEEESWTCLAIGHKRR